MGVLDVFRLDGKVALITGASSGLGWAFAEAMAEAGADVACVGRNEARVNQAAEMVRGLGRRAAAIRADVSKEDDVIMMTERTVAELGQLDIVFANAGIADGREPTPTWKLETWQRVSDVDLAGVFLTIREAAKVMVPRRRGKIISTSSVVGVVGYHEGHSLDYTAAKGGIISMTKTAAIALAPYGIQVNSIAPGFFKTPFAGGEMLEEKPDEETEQIFAEILRRIPAGRWGEPAETKGLAVFLVSAASDYVTGITIAIDGGRIAW